MNRGFRFAYGIGWVPNYTRSNPLPDYILARYSWPISDRIMRAISRLTKNRSMTGTEVFLFAEKAANKLSGNSIQTLKGCFGSMYHYVYFTDIPAVFFRGKLVGCADPQLYSKCDYPYYNLDKHCFIYPEYDASSVPPSGPWSNIKIRQQVVVAGRACCGVCGKIGQWSPSGVGEIALRYDVHGWDFPRRKNGAIPRGHHYSETILCSPCYNRARAVASRLHHADSLRALTNKLKKEEIKCQK